VGEVGTVLVLPAVTQNNEALCWCEAEQPICSVEPVTGNKPAGRGLRGAAREGFKQLTAPARGPAGLTWEATSPHQPSISF